MRHHGPRPAPCSLVVFFVALVAFGLSASAAAQGLDLEKVIEVVSQGAAGNWFLEHRGPTMIQGRFAAGFKVALHRKDLDICKAMAQELGVALSVVEQTLGDYQRLIDQGHGDEDISALFREKRALFEEGDGWPKRP